MKNKHSTFIHFVSCHCFHSILFAKVIIITIYLQKIPNLPKQLTSAIASSKSRSNFASSSSSVMSQLSRSSKYISKASPFTTLSFTSLEAILEHKNQPLATNQPFHSHISSIRIRYSKTAGLNWSIFWDIKRTRQSGMMITRNPYHSTISSLCLFTLRQRKSRISDDIGLTSTYISYLPYYNRGLESLPDYEFYGQWSELPGTYASFCLYVWSLSIVYSCHGLTLT